MKKVLLLTVIALICACGSEEKKTEKTLTDAEKNAIEYVKAKISNNVQVDSFTIVCADTLLCADMPEIDNDLFNRMEEKFGTKKMSEKDFRAFLDKRSDALFAISKSWAYTRTERVKNSALYYDIDELRLDKRWEPYWRTAYSVNVFINGNGHKFRVLMDSTGINAVATEDEFRKMINEKDDDIFDMFDI